MALSKRENFVNLDIDALEVVATLQVSDYSVLWLDFSVATAALSAFTVEYQIVGAGNWLPMAGVSGDFTTPNHPILKASGNLAAAGVGIHWIKLDVRGVQNVRIKAAGTSSVVQGYASKS